MRKQGLGPVIGDAPRLLILGSMPSEASLQKQMYYGHKRNHFWPLMADVLEKEDPGDYPARLKMLTDCGIALWDSIRACDRQGSLDQNIRDAQPNDIAGLLKKHPGIRAVAFNGTMARQVYRKHFACEEGIAYLLLPSSSPVPRRDIKTIDDKRPAWRQLRAYITE